MRIAVIGVFAAALVCCGCASPPTPKERFDKASVDAKANRATPAGLAYEEELSAHFQQRNGDVLMQCIKSMEKPDPASFEMIFEVSGTGAARSILVWPETNLALCFKERLISMPFPVPPKDGYLASMEMSFTP